MRILCDELLDNFSSPQRHDIKCLTDMIVQKYPMSFQDNTLGDLKMNDGAQSLFMQIEYRLGCCRRPMKFKFLSKLAHLFFQTAFSPVEH